MVKSGDDGSQSVAPFLKKCYEMVDDESTNSVISWSQNSDNAFIIWDMTEFSVQLLPKYFKHSNSSSFIRQLNIYGFKKIDADRWEFANEGFVKGQKHLLKNICRRKNSQSTENRKMLQQQQQENAIEPCHKVENDGLWKEIENLKTDKNALMQELVKLRQLQENANNKLLVLRDRVQGMEKNQQQMLSFLVMVMQSPGFLVQLLHPKENNWRMAEPGSIVEEDDEQIASDGMIIQYQPPQDEEIHTPVVSEKPQESSPLPDLIKDSFLSPDFVKLLMEEDISFDNNAPFVLPEFPDDSAWEQFLLATPFLENIQETTQENAENENETTTCGTQVDQIDRLENFQFITEAMDKYQNESNSNGTGVEKSENMEVLTEQMAHLASETS